MKDSVAMEDNKSGAQAVYSIDEPNYYPSEDKQYPNARKYMSYDSILTGVGGKQ